MLGMCLVHSVRVCKDLSVKPSTSGLGVRSKAHAHTGATMPDFDATAREGSGCPDRMLQQENVHMGGEPGPEAQNHAKRLHRAALNSQRG